MSPLIGNHLRAMAFLSCLFNYKQANRIRWGGEDGGLGYSLILLFDLALRYRSGAMQTQLSGFEY